MARNLVLIRKSYAYLHQSCSDGWPVRHAQPNGRECSVIVFHMFRALYFKDVMYIYYSIYIGHNKPQKHSCLVIPGMS